MPGKHKNPTISFRVSDYERRAIEANIKMSGMLKKDYFIRSCIYNRVCVVGKKETIYPLVEELRKMQEKMAKLGKQFKAEGEIAMPKEEIAMPEEEFANMQTDYLHLLQAVIRMLDGAKYLWEGDSGKEQE